MHVHRWRLAGAWHPADYPFGDGRRATTRADDVDQPVSAKTMRLYLRSRNSDHAVPDENILVWEETIVGQNLSVVESQRSPRNYRLTPPGNCTCKLSA